MLLYHGSPHLFDHFELTGAGKGTGIKFGHGVGQIKTVTVYKDKNSVIR